MGEAAGITFTILLFIAAFLGSGAYGVLSLADFRAARRGFVGTAASFAAIGVTLGVMTTWSLPIRVAVCAAFMAVAGGGLIWVLDYLKVRERLALNPVQTTESKREPPKVAEPSSEINLVAECDPFGGNVPIRQFHAIRQTKDGTFFSSGYVGSTPQQAGIIPATARVFAGGCQITNYGSVPIFTVRMSVRVQLFEIITPDPNNPGNKTSAKEPKTSIDVPIWFDKIDAGPGNAVRFSLMNLTPLFALASLPDSVVGARLGSNTTQTFPLAKPTQSGLPPTLPLLQYDGPFN